MKTNIYTNASGLKHDTGSGHPESIARLETVLSIFETPPFSKLPVIQARAASEEQIAFTHDISYIRQLSENTYENIDGDTIISEHSYQAALDAAGAACHAVDDVMTGSCDRAFCAVRPPGHHAMPNQAMGFCLFNNVFIAARYAQEKYGTNRIAIIDFDVHHGNGTDYMVRKAENIFYISSHQSPHYPGTGDPETDIKDKTLNIPLESGSGSKEFRKAYKEQAFPALHAFKPELIMISAGFDAHKDDQLSGLNFEDDDYFWITNELCQIAEKYCDNKVIAALEGGYNLDALKTSVTAHIKALTEF